MPKPANQSCDNCQYFFPLHQSQGNLGRCQFAPSPAVPIAVGVPELPQQMVFPVCPSSWWCGQWKKAT